ncbi:MAG: carboxypeptidase s, partial [Olpidium bornovanus]
MLAAHLDVVPVDPSTLDEWRFDPFSGKIAEGYVWGRGTSDDKLPLTAIFESLELLLESGFASPRRGIVVALGHDEEVGGNAGARAIS